MRPLSDFQQNRKPRVVSSRQLPQCLGNTEPAMGLMALTKSIGSPHEVELLACNAVDLPNHQIAVTVTKDLLPQIEFLS